MLGIRALVADRGRVPLAAVAVASAVAFMTSAVWILQRYDQRIQDTGDAEAADAELFVVGDIDLKLPLVPIRSLVGLTTDDRVAAVEGVVSAEERIESIAMIATTDGAPVVALGPTSAPLGADWPTEAASNPYEFVGPGRAPSGPDEVVIDRRSAGVGGYRVGDRVPILFPATGTESMELVGIVELRGGFTLPGLTSLAMFDPTHAGRLLGRSDGMSFVSVDLEEGFEPERAEALLDAALTTGAFSPGGIDVLDRAEFIEFRGTETSRSVGIVKVLLYSLATVALLTAGATLGSTFAVVFEHRRSAHALLRAVGASPRQVMTIGLIEAGLVGLAASLAGALGGLVLANAVGAALGRAGLEPPPPGQFPFALLALATLFGLLITLAAAWRPARAAAGLAPVPQITGVASGTPARGPLGLITFATGVVVLAGLSLVEMPLLFSLGLGIAASMICLVAVTRSLPRLSAAMLGGMAGQARPGLTLARAHLLGRSGRSGATGAAVVLVVFLLAFLLTLRWSVLSAIDAEVEAVVSADLVVDSGTFGAGGLSPELLEQLVASPLVERVSGWRTTAVEVDSGLIYGSGVEPGSLDRLLDLGEVSGNERLSGGGIVISDELAGELGVGLGDRPNVNFTNQFGLALEVTGIFTTENALIGSIVMDRNLVAEQAPGTSDVFALIDLADGADPEVAQRELETIASAGGADRLGTPKDVLGSRVNTLDGLLGSMAALVVLAYLVAMLGIANTVRLAVVDRSTELGTLRSLGMTRAQLSSMVTWEVAAIALAGACAGALVGAGLASALARAFAFSGVTMVALPWLHLLGLVGVATLLGWLAARAASRSASRRSPLLLRTGTW